MTDFDDAIIWLACAGGVIWLGLGSYLAFLGNRQKNLAKRLKQMELWRSEN